MQKGRINTGDSKGLGLNLIKKPLLQGHVTATYANMKLTGKRFEEGNRSHTKGSK